MPTYNVQVADTHHIHYLHEGGLDVSTNMLVVCPNHHRVIHESNARFNLATLSYEYPNGLQERLAHDDHIVGISTTMAANRSPSLLRLVAESQTNTYGANRPNDY